MAKRWPQRGSGSFNGPPVLIVRIAKFERISVTPGSPAAEARPHLRPVAARPIARSAPIFPDVSNRKAEEKAKFDYC